MLTNWADNFIIPSYTTLTNKLENLEASANTFTSSRNQQNLENLRNSFINAYLSWQYVEMFDIGLAEETYYKSKMNIYPTTASRIELNIQNGNTNFNNSNNYAAQGFPALVAMNLLFQNIILIHDIYPTYTKLSIKCSKTPTLLLMIGKAIETPLLVQFEIQLPQV